MGCPQPKIIRNGAGSALLENYNLMDELFSELLPKLDSDTKISIKIRTGYKNFNNPEIFLDLANKYNLDFICVHGRTQNQFYSGTANWEIVSNLSKLPRNTEFFGNGDLFEPKFIKEQVKKCNLDGIMLSRGVIGNPWLIAQAREFLQTGKIKTVKTFDNTKKLTKNQKYTPIPSSCPSRLSPKICRFPSQRKESPVLFHQPPSRFFERCPFRHPCQRLTNRNKIKTLRLIMLGQKRQTVDDDMLRQAPQIRVIFPLRSESVRLHTKNPLPTVIIFDVQKRRPATRLNH